MKTSELARAVLVAAGLLGAGLMSAWAQGSAVYPAPPASAMGLASTEVRALVVAEQEATIASQFDKAARVTSIRQVGDSFGKNDVLVSFDCQERNAAVRNFESRLMGARETHLAKLKLQSLGAAADIDVTNAAAAAEEARAQLQNAKVLENQCVIRAPYPGKVVRARAKSFEMVKPGDALLEIVNPATLRVQLFVPSTWFRTVKAGTPLKVQIDETGETYTARVSRISGRIDGSSQTVEVIAQFDRLPARPDRGAANILPGMIGRATFEGVR